MDDKLRKWREDGKHLPEFLKDFHDQKDFFQFLHHAVRVEDHPYLKDMDPIKGHAYIVDCVLHALARFGYTIQKSRAHQEFEDLGQAIQHYNDYRRAQFHQMITHSEESLKK